MSKTKLEVALVDFAGVYDSVAEITSVLLDLTDKKVAAEILLNEIIDQVEYATELWTEIRSLGYVGSRQDAYFDVYKVMLREGENPFVLKGGENDENAELPQKILTD